MFEMFIIGILILAALFYVGLRLWRSVKGGDCSCSSGCCSSVKPGPELPDLRQKDSGEQGCNGDCASCSCSRAELSEHPGLATSNPGQGK